MALKDLMRNIGGVFSRVSADMTRRPDGGTSHYRPLRKKAAEPLPGETMQMQGQEQDMRFVHTGFTGMNPPVNYGGYEQQTAYGQPAYNNQTAYSQPAYDQTAYGQTAYGQTAWNQQPYGQAQPAYTIPAQPAVNDSGSIGWAILGFFIPIVGLVLFLVWKNTKPNCAKMAGVGALVGFCLGLFMNIFVWR